MAIDVDPGTAASGGIGLAWIIREAVAAVLSKRTDPTEAAVKQLVESINGLALAMAGIRTAIECDTAQTIALLDKCTEETRRCGDLLQGQDKHLEVIKELLREGRHVRTASGR